MIKRNVDVEILEIPLGKSSTKIINIFNTSTQQPIIQISEIANAGKWLVFPMNSTDDFTLWRDAPELAIAKWDEVNSADWNVLGGK